MRFLLTLNMPAYSGALVHQIVCAHAANDLDELVDELNRNDFIIVEEFYKNPQTGEHYSRGEVAINHSHIGKIKILTNQHEG